MLAGVVSGNVNRRRALFDFALGVVAIVAVAVLAGPRVLAAFEDTAPEQAVLAACCATLAFGFWFEGLYRALRAVAPDMTRRILLLPYLGGVFARKLSPAGSVSFIAVTGYLLDRKTETESSKLFGAVSAWGFVSMVGSVIVAGVGLFGLASAGGAVVEELLVVFAVAATLLLVVFILAIQRNGALVGAIEWTAGGIEALIARTWPSAGRRFAGIQLADRTERFLDAARTVGEDRTNAAAALAAACLGWAATAGTLYFSAGAIGADISVSAAAVVVTVSGVGSILPLPGGLGGVEVALVAALDLLAGVPTVPAAATTLLYRAMTFWLPLAVSGTGLALHRRFE